MSEYSDFDSWVDVDLNWETGGDVTILSDGYRLNHGYITVSLQDMTTEQMQSLFGFHFTTSNILSNGARFIITAYTDAEKDDLDKASYTEIFIKSNFDFYEEIKFPNKCTRLDLRVTGCCDITDLWIYAVNTSSKVEPAKYSTLGTVAPIKKGGLKIAEKDDTATGTKVGDLSVNIGDGLNVNEEGQICITSNISGSNWQNLLRFQNGFIVNGKISNGTVDPSSGYFFERQSNGDLLYKNANRIITIASYSSNMPAYVAPTGGEANGV